MTTLSKKERVEAALAGDRVDRVPVSAWRHFIPDELQVDRLAETSLNFFFQYDWDWLKVNPRATYYAEAWGNTYDFQDYAHVYPKWLDGPVHTPEDLNKIGVVSGSSGVFDEQLQLIRKIKAGIGEALFVQTVFSPLSVLAFLIARPARHSADDLLNSQYAGLRFYMRENPQGVHAALQAISVTLADYASHLVEAGASGLFFAITKLARKDVMTVEEFETFGKPYDLQVLKAVQEAPFNLLHICGEEVYFKQAADYPVHAINWATIGQKNPDLKQAGLISPKALIGGVDELGVLLNGSPDEVRHEAQQVIKSSGGRHLLLAPGCGVNMQTPP
ncbi:MAG: hypothetical protein LWX83_18870, partial [Anaerolineae bacterium]|nr:hypothetical protein [Anaerolineae bacterium]